MSKVKVLLNEKVEKLGDIGEIVEVKAGYARNCLLPQGQATLPSAGELKRIQKKKELLEKEHQKEKDQAEDIIRKLNELPVPNTIEISAKAGEAGKLFGAITTKDIAEKINKELGIEIVRKQILLRRSIGEIGEYDIKLKLHTDVTSQIKVIIKSEQQ